MTDPRLGRIYKPDERDKGYLLRDKLGAAPQTIPSGSKLWPVPFLYDQGQTPECTAYAASTALTAYLYQRTGGHTVEFDAAALYAWANAHDGIPTPHDGSTVRAAFQGLQTVGDDVTVSTAPSVAVGLADKIAGYYWADTTQLQADIATIVQWVLSVGPVEIGINWYDGMFTPSSQGWIFPTGNIAGGHALTIRGVNTTNASNQFFVLRNTWGAWGVGVNQSWTFQPLPQGDAVIKLADLVTLLEQDGEAGALILK